MFKFVALLYAEFGKHTILAVRSDSVGNSRLPVMFINRKEGFETPQAGSTAGQSGVKLFEKLKPKHV